MFLVATLSILSLRALEVSRVREQRLREKELLYIGQLYYSAIKSYYDNSPGTAKVYPADFDALLTDDRTSTMKRHLRKIYRDPMNGQPFATIVDETGRIMGVHSTSQIVPSKTKGFAPQFSHFERAKSYRDWTFVYTTAVPDQPNIQSTGEER